MQSPAAVLVIAACSLIPVSTGTVLKASTLDLMPVPAEMERGAGAFVVDEGFTVTVAGGGATPRLRRGVERMLRRLSDRTTLFFDPEVFLDLDNGPAAALRVTAAAEGSLAVGVDESYRLLVKEDGIRLDAATDIGALRGLETLLQLLEIGEGGFSVPGVAIVDRPRFPWRGLMIDSSRHFMPLEVLKRNLDGMAAVKLNVLHWHLVDDQGFRVESVAWPRLHELGSDGDYYTRAQVREIIDYAADRGIRVVPEFDLPGHATAWLTAYPELASAPGPYRIERRWGIFDPTVNPIIDETYTFLDAFVADMAGLFDDEFIHIGGDENNGVQWLANPEIAAFMEAHGLDDVLALQRYFNERVLEIFDRYGKRMIGWDEILQPGLPTTAVIQSWRGRESLFAAARGGYSGILSNGYYIDLIQPTDFHYLNDPLPADTGLSSEEAARILGGEATMWSEFVSPETVDSRIWPRTAAIAERLWSPREVRDVADMYRRLDLVSLQLEELGLQHERNRPVMLRRLCRCRDIEPLEVLLGAIEPVKIYNRGRLRPHTQFSPLTRMVDAAWPDAGPAREFRWAVDRLLEGGTADAVDLAAARTALAGWRDNRDALEPILKAAPALQEMAPMSEALHDVAVLGLEALELLGADTEAGPDWLQPRLERLQSAREPHGQTELMIVDPVARLMCAAAGPEGLAAPGCGSEEETPKAGAH